MALARSPRDRFGRRHFVGVVLGTGASLASGALLAGCGESAGEAQAPPPAAPAEPQVVGWLSPREPALARSNGAFLEERLAELGYSLGERLVVEYRSAANEAVRLPGLAAELVQVPVAVLVCQYDTPVLAARQLTASLPIVFFSVDDQDLPRLGVSFPRPGGNVTGVTTGLTPEIYAKRLQLLKDAVPHASRVAVFLPSPDDPAWGALQATAQALAVELQPVVLRDAGSLELGLEAIIAAKAEALLEVRNDVSFANWPRLGAFLQQTKLPAMQNGTVGWALLSYSQNLRAAARRVADLVDRLLRGAKPADLPIERAREFDLTVNLRQARALGITLPTGFLAQATRVIE